ncbi:MAG: hypothetical protein IKT80_00580 [Bacteroidaceae bacterium]|nr:hypothetical protein [Bacteroidaceae bacterium]
MGILTYKTLDSFYQDYKPGFGFPKLLLHKIRFGVTIAMLALAPDSLAVIYQVENKHGVLTGKVFVSDSYDKLYPIYRDL